MKIRTERPFYFMATIYRKNHKIVRQGCINAEDEAEAIDRIYEMGREVWKRAVVKIVIMDPHSSEVLATSSIEDRYKENADKKSNVIHLPGPVKEVKKEETKHGFVPWGEREKEFWPSQVGTYFTPRSFPKLTLL